MNIFENAKFGDKFRTRDGRMAIYLGESHHQELAVHDGDDYYDVYKDYNSDGTYDANDMKILDIVSEWQEPIDEEELEKMAEEYVRTQYPEDNVFAGYCRRDFTAGYRAKCN